ncbi:hypothetical protein CDL60_17350 [Roseateles noduli]|nr:hypothetical protein CDL60_17350 [Roseateles noduli]
MPSTTDPKKKPSTGAAKTSAKHAATYVAKKAVKPAVKSTFRSAAPSDDNVPGVNASKMIDARIEELGDWRGEMLARLRKLMKQAVPGVEETWKWRGTPVFERNGQICTGETYKDVVKMTFAKGAKLADPGKLFNSSLDGNARRAIDIRKGEKIDETALKALFQEAAALNDAAAKPKKAKPAA